MIYSSCPITDNGYKDRDTGETIPDISGLDNKSPGQRFYHAGKSGYPDIEIFSMCECGCSCLCMSDNVPTGATILTRSAFIEILKSNGWGDGVYVGIDGCPHREGDNVAELPDVSAENTRIIIDAQRMDNLTLLRDAISAMADGAEKLALQAILKILEEES